MVRTMPGNTWRWADFLERVRPGFAVSAALHIGLFLLLGYFLAFHRGLTIEPQQEDPPFVLVEPPKPPPPTVQVQRTTSIKTITTRTFDRIHLPPMVPPFPTNDDAAAGTSTAPAVVGPPAPPVIINPTPIYRGALTYPDRAADAGQQGYVDFDFIIEPDGTVGDPHVISELPPGYDFAAAAVKAFPKWRFKPMLKDGVPIAAPARIRVSFKLG